MENSPDVIRLDAVFPKDWFPRALDANPGLRQLGDLLGQRFVALCIVCGVRVTALTVDRNFLDASMVEFVIGEQTDSQRLAMGEFRSRLVASLLATADTVLDLPAAPALEDVQRHIGVPFLLLAPVFGMELKELLVKEKPPLLRVEIDGAREELSAKEFRDALGHSLRLSLDQQAAPSFTIDLDLVDDAQVAFDQKDYDKVIELLGPWPAPLSRLFRMPGGSTLSEEQRHGIARGLWILSRAFGHNSQDDWSQEVIRLAIQWAHGLPIEEDLFRTLAEISMARGDFGQAIGLLRRALVKGTTAPETLPLLAECYAERGRYVAAMVCIEQAERKGAAPIRLKAVKEKVRLALGNAQDVFSEALGKGA
ncbi:MAG: hypothetical protein H6715_06860 [Myxococcales bacterium]|nr:hypothetical protein [Myxococcales bacterium]MCB9709288.1 hypothetical protein [Myxococcales bacterium]